LKPIVFKVPSRPQQPPPFDFPDGYTGGMRIDLSPDKIPPNSSPSMENLNYNEGAVISKRYGYSKISEASLAPTPIRAMTEFKTGGVTEFLVVCGGSLFKQN